MDSEEKSPAAYNKKTDLVEVDSREWNVSAYRSVEGGGTGEEFTDNLKYSTESGGSKWYDCWSGETWIKAAFNQPTRVRFIQLKSANDCQERDPHTVTIEIKYNANDEYRYMGEWANLCFSNRFQCLDIDLDTGDAITELKINITKNRSFAETGSWGSGTQLAQVKFYR
jgi:hypothetical protein